MAKKFYVFDTSVCLTDFNSVYSYGNNDIVIPFKVLDEIDNHKQRQDGVGTNARGFIRMLDLLREKGSIIKGARIDKGKGLLIARGYSKGVLPEGFDITTPDNQIIATALSLMAENEETKRKVVLVSRDINMRVKCDSLGILTEDYSKEKVVNNRTDIYTGMSSVLVDDQLIDQFYEGDKDVFLGDDVALYPNEFVMMVSSSNEKKTAIGRYLNEGSPLMFVPECNGSMKKKAAWGIKPRNKEQGFALNLLRDPEIHLVSLIGKAGSGKAQPLHSKILTPEGWSTMGDMKVGSRVIGRDGRPANVVGIFPQGKKGIYKITFSDGTSTEACGEHLWLTRTQLDRDHSKQGSVKTTKEILNTLKYGKKTNHSIPIAEPIQFERDGDLPIDPYLLGCLIGDGTMSVGHPMFSTADEELVTTLNNLLSEVNCKLNHASKYDYRIVNKGYKYKNQNPVKEILKEIKLWGKKSYEKYLPEDYKFSSVGNRLQLLRGLMDTDGTVPKSGIQPTFCSTSEALASDVAFLVRSLGGKATISSRVSSYTYKGVKKQGRRSYRVRVSLPEGLCPFSLARKAEAWRPNKAVNLRKYIKSVEYVGEKEAQCIMVDNHDHLYITDDLIVTHNTLCAIAAGLEQVLGKRSTYSHLIVSRSIQPMGKDLGYLPGTLEEKMMPWIAPIRDNLKYLMGNDHEALDNYLDHGVIEIEALTYIRGRSISNAFIIIDEAQNLTMHELKTIITRAGEGTKIVLTGDIEQIDNVYVDEVSNGLTYAVEKFKEYDISGHVTLLKGERSRVATLAAKIL